MRLLITAEGPTEINFVNRVLAPYLGARNIFTEVRSVLTSKDNRLHKEHRGGLYSYDRAKHDITDWIKADHKSECWFSTMFDFYALPKSFPGYDNAQKTSYPYEKIKTIEEAFRKDISLERFVPYIQLHEFEALILSDPSCLGKEYIDQHKGIQQLTDMVKKEGDNPELINDGYDTAPSRRIKKAIKGYNKISAGSIVAEAIGLDKMREKCRHFNDWVTRLENLAEA